MNWFEFGLGFLFGLIPAAYFIFRAHYYASLRDEWNAGKTIRGMLNALLEKHRYSKKRGDDGPFEFFRFANRDFKGNGKLVDQLDHAVNEFQDFLNPKDQQQFLKLWQDERHRIRKMENRIQSAELNETQKQELAESFQLIHESLESLKFYTLKVRNQPWWLNSMPLIPARRLPRR